MKYGLVLGRMQPMHLGHQQIINQVIQDGKMPIIILGSDQESGTLKNPFTKEQRVLMVKSVFGREVIVDTLSDNKDWDSWYDSLYEKLCSNTGNPESDIEIYAHHKPEDLINRFVFRGENFTNTYYTDMFYKEGFRITTVDDPNFKIRASTIREDYSKYKSFLHPNVYSLVKKFTKVNK